MKHQVGFYEKGNDVKYTFYLPFCVELGISWTEDDIIWLKEQRRFFAQRQQLVSYRGDRKYCIRMVKVTTIILNYMTGVAPDFLVDYPMELERELKTVFCFMYGPKPRTCYKDLYETSIERIEDD